MTKLAWSAIVCACALAWPSEASSQSRPERPYRGLFRGFGQIPERAVTLTVSLGGGYDDDVFAQSQPAADPLVWDSGGFTRLAADLSYVLESDAFSFGASIATDTRYFPALPEDYLGTHSGSIGFSHRVGREGRFKANQSVSYQPFLSFNVFPEIAAASVGDAEAGGHERGTPFDDVLSYSTAVDFSQPTSRRGTVTLRYGLDYSDFVDTNNDQRVQTAGGLYLHELTRGLGLRLGYQFTGGQYLSADDERAIRNHMLDIGLDFRRALSFSRRTSLSFSTGSAAVREVSATHYRLVADVVLNHEMGRTWNVGLAYDRGVMYLPGVGDPLMSDGIRASLGGFVHRRVELSFEAGSAFGEAGFSSEPENGFVSNTASTTMTVGLTRNLALIGTYAFYQHSFDSGVLLAPGLAPDIDRHTVQALLSVWVPLYQRGRRTNASR